MYLRFEVALSASAQRMHSSYIKVEDEEIHKSAWT